MNLSETTARIDGDDAIVTKSRHQNNEALLAMLEM